MQNLDIYILTSVIATLFLVFIIGIYRAVKDIDAGTYQSSGKEGGPRAALFNLMAKLFEDETIPKKEKKKIIKAMTQTLADMESDGIRFPDNVREEMEKQREESFCEYSGLPSPKAYEFNKDLNR